MSDHRARIIERNGRVHAFDRQKEPVGIFKTRAEAMGALDLAKQADAMLQRANCDVVTGAKKDRAYRRAKRAQQKHVGRRWRA
jgi:hypothetical protein